MSCCQGVKLPSFHEEKSMLCERERFDERAYNPWLRKVPSSALPCALLMIGGKQVVVRKSIFIPRYALFD